MADDLGDSHPNSLRQGGALPADSTATRVVGKIFPAAARTVTVDAYPQFPTNRYEILVLAGSGAQITNAVGSSNLTLTYTPPATEYETILIHYPEPTNVSQRVWMKINYTAPTSLKPPPPRLADLRWLPNRQIQFTLTGGSGLSYVIQSSPDLARWSAIATNTAPFDFIDTIAGTQSLRVYRGVYFP
jgi:hypothetical protein